MEASRVGAASPVCAILLDSPLPPLIGCLAVGRIWAAPCLQRFLTCLPAPSGWFTSPARAPARFQILIGGEEPGQTRRRTRLLETLRRPPPAHPAGSPERHQPQQKALGPDDHHDAKRRGALSQIRPARPANLFHSRRNPDRERRGRLPRLPPEDLFSLTHERVDLLDGVCAHRVAAGAAVDLGGAARARRRRPGLLAGRATSPGRAAQLDNGFRPRNFRAGNSPSVRPASAANPRSSP